MKTQIFLPLLSLFVLFSCQKEKVNKEPIPIEISEKSKEILSANNQFGFDLLKKAFNESSSKNLMISPLSVSQALSMTYNGAANETKTAFENLLHFNGQTTSAVNQASLDLTNALLNVDPKINIKIANSIWYKKGFSVENDFILTNQKYYSAKVQELDFSNPQSKDIINAWVNEKTNKLIPKIIDQILPEDVMFLINAIYFKGSWKAEFDKKQTGQKPFYLSNGSVKNVETMQLKSYFSVYYAENYSVIDLPYGQGNFSMLIVLPTDESSLSDLIKNMDAQTWSSIVDNLQIPMSKELKMPKFKFEYENELNNELTDLGLGVAFSDFADFTGINKNGGLYVSRVKHKSFIEVNEEGTEAAAVTSVTVGVTSAGPDSNIFAIDHPFLFAIKEKFTNAILFLGTVTDPTLTK
ncbi:MAG: serpin family protein, partial [Bacteroidota bacterium]